MQEECFRLVLSFISVCFVFAKHQNLHHRTIIWHKLPKHFDISFIIVCICLSGVIYRWGPYVGHGVFFISKSGPGEWLVPSSYYGDQQRHYSVIFMSVMFIFNKTKFGLWIEALCIQKWIMFKTQNDKGDSTSYSSSNQNIHCHFMAINIEYCTYCNAGPECILPTSITDMVTLPQCLNCFEIWNVVGGCTNSLGFIEGIIHCLHCIPQHSWHKLPEPTWNSHRPVGPATHHCHFSLQWKGNKTDSQNPVSIPLSW